MRTAHNKQDLSQWLQRAKQQHGDKYDYSKVVYTKARDKVVIICDVHGEFEQVAHSHVKGMGCKKCALSKTAESRKLNIANFIARSNEIHENRYDYSSSKYITSATPLVIICPIHGEFEQTPSNHLAGKGCQMCANARIGESRRNTVLEFINKSREVHGDKYSYDKVEYITTKNHVTVTCAIHGDFSISPNNHQNGKGCPGCAIANNKAENEFYNFISDITSDAHRNDRTLIKPMELDVIVPSKKIAFEFNGTYWHSLEHKPKGYHQAKRKFVESVGWRLISVGEQDWKDRRPQIERIIKTSLGVSISQPVNARECEIVCVNNDEYIEFMNEHHVQKSSAAPFRYGLKHPEHGLVAIMSFRQVKHGANIGWWDMVRYATSHNVRGGSSKLFKHAAKILNMDKCQSFTDCDYFTGNSYCNSGFQLVDDSTVSFRVWHRKFGYMSRQAWWKAAIPKTLEKLGLSGDIFDGKKTQREMMRDAGALIIENSGTKRYEWRKGA